MKKLILFSLFILLATTSWAVHTGGAGHDNPEVWVGVAAHVNLSTGGTMTVTTAESFEKVAGGSIAYTGLHLEHFSHNTGRATYTGRPDKDMLVVVSGAAESGEIAQEVKFRLAKNGITIVSSETQATFTAQNAHSPFSLNYIIELSTNDYIEMFATSDTNADDIIFHSMVMCTIQYE